MNSKLFFVSLFVVSAIAGFARQGRANEKRHIVGIDFVTMERTDHGVQPQDKAGESKAVEAGNKICPVSGNKIPVADEKGDMGEAVQYEYNGKIYNLCCKMCVKDFKRDPEKYSRIAEEEIAHEKTMDAGHEERGLESDPGHSGHKH